MDLIAMIFTNMIFNPERGQNSLLLAESREPDIELHVPLWETICIYLEVTMAPNIIVMSMYSILCAR